MAGCKECGALPDYGDGMTWHRHGCPYHNGSYCLTCARARDARRRAVQARIADLWQEVYIDPVARAIVAAAWIRIDDRMET